MESFYRVQDDAGIGPYQNAEFAYTMGTRHTDSIKHRSPYMSGRYLMNPVELCGFRTMQDLFRWFGGYLPILLKNGYQIVKVEGTLRYEDCCQVVFKPER